MKDIRLHTDSKSTATCVPNTFIDHYMADANGEFVKIYLYLLRCMSYGDGFSITGMADKFENTEKDIFRALKYWEKLRILRLEYDEGGQLAGICLSDSNSFDSPTPPPDYSPADRNENLAFNAPADSTVDPAFNDAADNAVDFVSNAAAGRSEAGDVTGAAAPVYHTPADSAPVYHTSINSVPVPESKRPEFCVFALCALGEKRLRNSCTRQSNRVPTSKNT